MKSKRKQQIPTPRVAESTPPSEAATPQSSTPRPIVSNIAVPSKQEPAGPATTKPPESGTKSNLPIKALQPAGKMGGTTDIEMPTYGWTQDYYKTICRFEPVPEKKAMLQLETERDMWVVESINLKITRKRKVRRNRYYVHDLKGAIELAAHIAKCSATPGEQVVDRSEERR